MSMAIADAPAPGTQGRTPPVSAALTIELLPAAPSNRRPSPPTADLALDASRLSSNNPFRNRLSAQSPASMDSTVQQFPFPATTAVSKNPFLDPTESAKKSVEIPAAAAPALVNGAAPPVNNNTAEVEDIFKGLAVSDNTPAFSNGPIAPKEAPVRSGTLPVQPRPSALEERRDRRGPPRGPNGISPQKPPEYRRRASESSVMEGERRERRDRQVDRGDRPPRTESEERRRRERRKEREERHKRRENERVQNGGKPRRPFRNLDLIDKLDVTGVYGQGLFHHDGPFDACNPARNTKKDRRAPMQAFPEGSMNMAIGGAGPNRSRLDLAKFHGHTEDAFTDFNVTRKADTSTDARPSYERNNNMNNNEAVRYVNAHDRGELVHGEESYGLGTSTFLEGAPASRRALQRRESEEQQQGSGYEAAPGGGLQRKKSLAQRFRGMSASRPRGLEGARSPEARYTPGTPIELSDNPPAQVKPASAGGVYTNENEINPYEEAFEKRGTEIKFAEQEKPSSERARAPGSPQPLARSLTADSAAMGSGGEDNKVGGLLSRMKSLKGRK